jgi:hypothetical protein
MACPWRTVHSNPRLLEYCLFRPSALLQGQAESGGYFPAGQLEMKSEEMSFSCSAPSRPLGTAAQPSGGGSLLW